MPVYDYKCESCELQFDELVSFTKNKSEIKCPNCKKKNSKRMLSAPSISTNEHSAAPANSCGAPGGGMSKLILWSQIKYKFIITSIIATIFIVGCEKQNQPEVMVIGELKKIMHGGAREGIVNLAEVMENEHLYGLGAMENLDGEIIIMNNEILISRAELGQIPEIQLNISENDKALLLVSSSIKSWEKTLINEPVVSGTIDAIIEKYAGELGMDTQKPFPFIIKGEFEIMNWHIISSPEPGGSHDDHLKQSWKRFDKKIKGTILGFYSEHHKSVFTHHTTFTHMHILYEDENLSGHVDEMSIQKNWSLKVPSN